MLFSNPQLKHLNVNMIPSPFDEEDTLSSSLESNASMFQNPHTQSGVGNPFSRTSNTNTLFDTTTFSSNNNHSGVSGLTSGFAAAQQNHPRNPSLSSNFTQQHHQQVKPPFIMSASVNTGRGFGMAGSTINKREAFPSPDKTTSSFSFDPKYLSQPQSYREPEYASPPSVTSTSFFDAVMQDRQNQNFVHQAQHQLHPSISRQARSFDAGYSGTDDLNGHVDDEWRYVITPRDLAQVEQSLQTLVFKDHVRQQYKNAASASSVVNGSGSMNSNGSPATFASSLSGPQNLSGTMIQPSSNNDMEFMDDSPDEATVLGTSAPSSIMGWDALQQQQSIETLSSSPAPGVSGTGNGLRQRSTSLFSKPGFPGFATITGGSASNTGVTGGLPSSFPLSTFHVSSDPIHSIPEDMDMEEDHAVEEDFDEEPTGRFGEEDELDEEDENDQCDYDEDVFKFDDTYSPRPPASQIEILVQASADDDDHDSIFDIDDDDNHDHAMVGSNHASSQKSTSHMKTDKKIVKTEVNATGTKSTKNRKKNQPMMVPLTAEQQQAMVIKLLSNPKNRSKDKSFKFDGSKKSGTSSDLFATSAPAAIVMDKTASALLAVPPGPLVIHPVSPRGPAAKANRNSSDKAFQCELCSSTFSRNHDLKRHIRIHLGIRPFTCETCLKTFTRRDALDRHLTVKGCKTSQRPSGTSRNASPATASASAEKDVVTTELIRQSLDKVRAHGKR